MKTVAHFTARV